MTKREMELAEYFDNHDFGDEFYEAEKNGTLIVSLPGESVFDAIKRRDEMLKEKETKKTVPVRLPARVVNEVKAQAAIAGVPWTSYARNIFEQAVMKTRGKVGRTAPAAHA